MNPEQIKVAIAEPSVIIRSGITVALKRVPGFRIQPIEISSIDTLNSYLRMHKPDILIINPAFWGYFDISKLKQETSNPQLKCMALICSPIDESLLRNYDHTVSIYDSVELLQEKLDKLLDSSSDDEVSDETNTLSLREKEIIVCVVKGLTNKEIAESLFLSTHTVITHRRNIARKLEIRSTAGLTIYAIVNKLVELDEINKK